MKAANAELRRGAADQQGERDVGIILVGNARYDVQRLFNPWFIA
ncbi:MAG: hypothetical protein ABIU85_09550 [Methylotenera sp.]